MAEAKEIISDREFRELVSTLCNSISEKSRLIRLKSALGNFWFTCDQAKELIGNKHFAWNSSEGPVHAAVAMYPRLVDPEGFEEKIVSLFKFDDIKDEIRSGVGLT